MRQVFSSIPGQVLDFMVVLVGLVIIFKEKITEVVNSIFTKITNQTKKI
ncbi:Flp1 family type IVb pilin [Waltera sp.]